MARCTFCKRRFASEQSVKAHLRFCPRYKLGEKNSSNALGTMPKAETTRAASAVNEDEPMAQPAGSNPFAECFKAMSEFASKSDEPQSPAQRRRALLQEIKEQVINQYRPPQGAVTTAMRGAAKAAIERELSTVSLEELPPEELYEIGAAIRDQLYDPVFEKQALEAQRQQAEKKAERRTEIEEWGKLIRANRRKCVHIQQASALAHAYCDEKQIIRWAQLSVVGDIEARLGELLTGDEPIAEAQAIVRYVLDARFAEADAKQAAAQTKHDAKWRDEMLGLLVLGGVMALPLLASKYPEQVLAITSWIEQCFGKSPISEDGTTAKAPLETEASSVTSSAPPRRRRKHPTPPSSPEPPQWGESVGAMTHGQGPRPPEERVSADLSSRGAESFSHTSTMSAQWLQRGASPPDLMWGSGCDLRRANPLAWELFN